MSDDRLTVEFEGERFAMAERIGMLPLMRFAKVAKNGVDSASMEALVAMYDLLEQCIADDEWARFCEHADRTRADGESLMRVTSDVIASISDRPTSRPSDSPDGSPTTSTKSAGDSSSQVIADLEELGRPDLALIVQQAQERMASA